uniref:hypothetical protein n=1 Tax=Flavobacterium sp. TaxID=239 RepID=UPI00286D7A45
MKRTVHLGTMLFLLVGCFANAQDIVWTGSAANNDFFDEANWKNSATNSVPSSGTIDSGIAINLSLQLNNAAITVIANGDINLGTGSLSIGMASLTAQSLAGAGGNVAINEGGYIELTSTAPLKSS